MQKGRLQRLFENMLYFCISNRRHYSPETMYYTHPIYYLYSYIVSTTSILTHERLIIFIVLIFRVQRDVLWDAEAAFPTFDH